MIPEDNNNPIEPVGVEGLSNIQIGCDRLLDINWDGHGQFRGLCLAYGDFYRPVLLKEFVARFVRKANRVELEILSGKIAIRREQIRRNRKGRGRPRAEEDADWLEKARNAALKRIVDGQKWREIAESEGKEPSKPNLRTLKNREDRYAAIIWDACSEAGIWRIGCKATEDIERLKDSLETTNFRVLLCRRTLLPFNIIPGVDLTAQCKKIVLTLAPRGGKTVARQTARVCIGHERI